MARILYSVQGVGMGHAMRSKTIIEYLKKQDHQVLITANNKAYKFFKKIYSNLEVHKLKGADFILDNQGRVKAFSTLAEYFKTLPRYSYYNFKKLVHLIEEFNPDIIITDFEPFAQFISHFYDLPLISIDNQHRITHCQLDIPSKYRDQYLEARAVIRTFILTADYYLITDFADSRIKRKDDKVYVVPPVIRKKILEVQENKQDHIVVYMWKKYAKNIIPELKKVKNQKFIVYGLQKSKHDGNVVLRDFSEIQMAKDLASAKAVIANAGFTLITESLYLHKPIMVVPMGGQFEQILNGLQLEKEGYGLMVDKIDQVTIESFIQQLPKFKKRVNQIDFKGNKKVFETLDKIIKKEVKKK